VPVGVKAVVLPVAVLRLRILGAAII